MVFIVNRVIVSLLMLLVIVPYCYSWSQEELDLFDLVEEVNENFYTFLQVPQDAPLSDIKRAYRKLSLQYHPDKNRDDPNASERFRKIGAVADVLKDEEMRAMYDEVLEHGLPDWRQPVYYYRRVRKMSLLELSILLMVVIMIGQLLYGWAVYAEKQLVLYELRERKEKKDRKAKGRKSGTINSSQLEAELLYHEALAKAALPHYTKMFPYVLVKNSIRYTLILFHVVFGLIQRLRQSKPNEVQEEEIDNNEFEKEQQIQSKEQQQDNKQNNKKKKNGLIKSTKEEKEEEEEEQVINETPPSCEILVEDNEKLRVDKEEEEKKQAQLMYEKQKELEAQLELLEENIIEEEEHWNKKTKHAKRPHSNKIKSPLADKSIEYQQPQHQEEEKESVNRKSPSPIEDKTSLEWTQSQQRQLELALKKYGKDEENRWENIAELVPNKTKEECMVRYRELVELVRQKKSQ